MADMSINKKAMLMQILTTDTHDVNVTFNKLKDANLSSAREVVIHNCSASTVNKLVEAGFSLFVTTDGVIVYHYKEPHF